jgi:hypothetical protein
MKWENNILGVVFLGGYILNWESFIEFWGIGGHTGIRNRFPYDTINININIKHKHKT